MARGYPSDLVKKWIKENYGKRWENRLKDPKPSPLGAFVLKSHFNPAWSAFNVHELGKQVTNSWLSSLAAMEQREQARKHHARGPVLDVYVPTGPLGL